MEFESPEVMNDFPGLFGTEQGKKISIDNDYSDDIEKLAKKDLLKRKEKKDKEHGYAALEGESSAEENESRSPSKIKKGKAFKFSTKSKEKREKSKEKDGFDKKFKDKEKKGEKLKKERKIKCTEENDIADGMPIFGVPLDIAVERNRCHDGIDLPLVVRSCIDHVQSSGLSMEGIYKISGPKAKVIQLRKLINQRTYVVMSDYEMPVVTGLLKLFLRDLPESIFTTDLLIRFEEAGAILNVGTREKHLKILLENIPSNNRLLLAWLLLHFDEIILNDKLNKMNITNLVAALAPTMRTSNRLLTALIYHCRSLFPTLKLEKYMPPLSSTAVLPTDLDSLECELKKQESLLAQIHAEMNAGYIIKPREEQLWEVQRIITQLKRKIKNLQKEEEKIKEDHMPGSPHILTQTTYELSIPSPACDGISQKTNVREDQNSLHTLVAVSGVPIDVNLASGGTETPKPEIMPFPETKDSHASGMLALDNIRDHVDKSHQSDIDDPIAILKFKYYAFCELRDKLTRNILEERKEIICLKQKIKTEPSPTIPFYVKDKNIEDIMNLLLKENQILEIKKVNLVRQIMEHEEMCIDLRGKLEFIGN